MEIVTIDQQNIMVGIRPIERCDESTLYASEVMSMGRAVAKVRRESAAARVAARTLLGQLGFPPRAILKTRSGVPIWPAGVIGSLAHHDTVAAAAIAGTKSIAALGVDIEPNEPLPENLIELIATPHEQRMYDLHTLKRRDLFVLKEAVYKACFPMDRQFLDFQDVEIDIFARSGHVSKANRTFLLELLISKNVIGVAYSRPNEVGEPLQDQQSAPKAIDTLARSRVP
ncbi:4'-phosphopantetheinyl transferase family protein [Bradyrhizobium australafricanum]|uniref:4'-phosphopantetheinyl transferase family protein n=1 Tax=Bradyrhizobium australafricanum TaxID=2821406 RepID=UPI001CE36A0E|nr:4'-phosphopantetheinyl transferase superfamily protein [Bradyrhizobium australafricanum]MCA6104582.1 4'-phosphopantetheinyl transferase superfamily protein [Bradyrhizobium australafricanum]